MRNHNWPEMLHEVIAKAKRKTFVWGTHDCALFVCDCIQAMTGIDYAKKFRGKYRSEKGSWKALKKIESVESLSELADKFLGDRIKLSNAGRGDIVILIEENREVLGVVTGTHAAFLSPDGVQMRTLTKCKFAWKVN